MAACVVCQVTPVKGLCPHCGERYYCSNACQQIDWEQNVHNEKCLSSNQRRVTKIHRVIDGDTVVVTLAHTGDAESTVRLLDIDAPERGQPYADTASRELQKLLRRYQNKLFLCLSSNTDRYGRTLGTFMAIRAKEQDWLNINQRLVLIGAAWDYDGRYASEQREAIRNRRGLWANTQTPVVRPSAYRKRLRGLTTSAFSLPEEEGRKTESIDVLV
jgi:endonuclease YncB( thermonuclease family)